MVENTVYRYKTIIGRSMRSRTFDGQRVEVPLACRILNTMTRLGMPDSLQSRVIPTRGTGDLPSVQSHAPMPLSQMIPLSHDLSLFKKAACGGI